MIIHQNNNSRSNYNYNLWYYSNLKYYPHFHRNLELVYVISGELVVTIDKKEEFLKMNDYALVLSNQIHSYTTENCSECLIVVFSQDYVPKFIQAMKNKCSEFAKFNLTKNTHDFVQQVLKNDNSSVMMKKACFYSICDEYLNKANLCDKKTSDIKIERILEYISENYMENLTLEFISKKFGYEYHYLSRLLNKCYHINFRELLNEYRIEAAKEMLSEGKLRISDIAFSCGFQSLRSFNHAFKRITECSPSEYSNGR